MTALALTTAGAAAATERLIEFEILDQFDRVHTHEELLGRVAIVIGGDRVSTETNGDWSHAISVALGEANLLDEVRIFPIADLKGAPFFVKNRIKSSFSEDEEDWALLDWKSVIPKAYGFVKKNSNVVIFAPDGALVYQTYGTEPPESDIRSIVAAVAAAVGNEQ